MQSAIASSMRLPSIRRRFWKYVHDQRIDVVLGTMSHLWNAAILLRRPRIPYMFVLHDAEPHAGDDIFLRRWLLGQEIRRADQIVTLTGYVRDALARLYVYPRERVVVIPHGVFPYAMPRGTTAEPGSLRLLFFGRLLPYKGLDLLIAAYAELVREFRNLRLAIVGPGDVSRYVGQTNLPGLTLDNRWIPEDEVGRAFENADLLVTPYREASQSGVIATAYAAGLPVVTTPVGGLQEQVQHERTGLVAEAVSSAAIVKAVRRMIEQPDLYARCAAGAYREARETLAWTTIARQFAATINNVITSAVKEKR